MVASLIGVRVPGRACVHECSVCVVCVRARSSTWAPGCCCFYCRMHGEGRRGPSSLPSPSSPCTATTSPGSESRTMDGTLRAPHPARLVATAVTCAWRCTRVYWCSWRTTRSALSRQGDRCRKCGAFLRELDWSTRFELRPRISPMDERQSCAFEHVSL